MKNIKENMPLNEDLLKLAGIVISRKRNKQIVKLLYQRQKEALSLQNEEEKERRGRLYFNEIFRELGGSRSSLAGSLDELVIHGIVRNMVAKIPEGLVRFYSLTDDEEILELIGIMYDNGMLN